MKMLRHRQITVAPSNRRGLVSSTRKLVDGDLFRVMNGHLAHLKMRAARATRQHMYREQSVQDRASKPRAGTQAHVRACLGH